MVDKFRSKMGSEADDTHVFDSRMEIGADHEFYSCMQ